jgi:small subunit ribosomal protein S6
MRNYELMFVADPRLTDEEFVSMSDDYRTMITGGGASIVAEESWGRRKLAYPIEKVTEGRYMLFFVEAEGKNPLPDVEHRMRQNDKILRYITVRTEGVRRLQPPSPEDERRDDRGERGDRFDRGDRGDRGDRFDRGDRGDRGDRPDRGGYGRGEE